MKTIISIFYLFNLIFILTYCPRVLSKDAKLTKTKTIFETITCSKCHEKIEKKFIHKAAADKGKDTCLNCHYLHGKLQKKRAKFKLKKKCISCHKGKAIHKLGVMSYHPTKNKIDHLTGKALSCLTCHNPHSSSIKFLFRYNYNTDTPYNGNLCLICHWNKGRKSIAPPLPNNNEN